MKATDDTDAQLSRLVPSAVNGDRRALQQVIDIIHPAVLREQW